MAGKICEHCAYRIINEKYHCVKSIGNRFSDKIIVLPYIEAGAKNIIGSKAFQAISNLYKDLFDRDILDDYYITCLTKCPANLKYPFQRNIIDTCYAYIYQEFIKYSFNKCIFVGNAASYLANIFPRKEIVLYVRPVNIKVFAIYNPYVIRYDNMKDLFMLQLSSIFKAYKYDDYNNLKIDSI